MLPLLVYSDSVKVSISQIVDPTRIIKNLGDKITRCSVSFALNDNHLAVTVKGENVDSAGIVGDYFAA